MLNSQKLKTTESSISEGRKLRKLIEHNLKEMLGNPKDKKVALLLSAGIDSTVAGIAAHNLGAKVHAYTFQLGEKKSFDSKWAENTANYFGWKWTLIKVPDDEKTLARDFFILKDEWDCRKKRDYECTQPMLYVYPKIQEEHVISGLVFDGYFILSRNAILSGNAGPKSTKEKFDAYRKAYWTPLMKKGFESLSTDYNPSCLFQHIALQKEYNLIDCNPYIKKNILDFFLKYSWQELNMPRQKHFMAGTYPEELSAVGHRNHVNYQLGADIDHLFEKLLENKKINYRNRRRVMDMCRDWENSGQCVTNTLFKTTG